MRKNKGKEMLSRRSNTTMRVGTTTKATEVVEEVVDKETRLSSIKSKVGISSNSSKRAMGEVRDKMTSKLAAITPAVRVKKLEDSRENNNRWSSKKWKTM